jgi:hypothetical protein
MTRIKSTAQPVSSAAFGGSGGKGDGSEERTISEQPSDAGSQSDGSDARAKNSRSWSLYFGPSTVTVCRIRSIIVNGYFANGMGHEPGEETVPEPRADEAVLFEEFFTDGLRMPLHHVLAAILLKYQIQIHQLTPNAIVQLSKYISAVTCPGGVPSVDGFVKRYELHYQPRKMDVGGADV